MKIIKPILLMSILLFIAACSEEEFAPDPPDATLNAIEMNSNYSTVMNVYDNDFNVLATPSGEEGQYVPLTGTFEVYISNVIHPGPPPPKEQEIEGEGNMSHMGNTDVYIHQFWWPPGPPPYVFPWTGTGIGDFTFTAANGDKLYAHYVGGTGTHVSATEVIIYFDCEITGGTGRFEDAQGSFLWEGEFDPTINLANTTVNGEILY